jgi:hypothetical protein
MSNFEVGSVVRGAVNSGAMQGIRGKERANSDGAI